MVIEAVGEKEEDNKFVNEIVERNDIKEKIYDWADDQSEFGFFILLGRVDDKNKYIIESVPQDQYFPQADGSVIFATYKRDPADQTGNRLLCFTQNYQIDNGIVLIDCLNNLRAKGMSLDDAVRKASSMRFRPIVMTALTTILGLLPMALAFGKGSELRAPLAISVMGGLFFSTFLTLVVIPSIFLIENEVRGKVKQFFTKKKA